MSDVVRKEWPRCSSSARNSRGVICFAVVGDPGLAVRAGHGHAPALAQVDDGEACVYQEARWEFLDALAVRAAMSH